MEKSELRVILPEEMPDIGIPPFGGRYNYENEYREYLLKSQPLFEEFERTGEIAEVEALRGKPMVGLTSEEEWLHCFEHDMMGTDCVSEKSRMADMSFLQMERIECM